MNLKRKEQKKLKLSNILNRMYASTQENKNIITIHKDNRVSLNSSDNYRGISVSDSICKLYDYVFIDLNIDYLKTDDM